MERNCRKCGEYIPYSKVIEGKRKNLQNRKFCLNCSRYRGHNTKSDDPTRESKKRDFKDWIEEDRLLYSAKIYRRGVERKEKLIELAGGKCIKCGYNKCHKALAFHHRDPGKKEFGLSINKLWSTSWEKILQEFEKCDLLCVRCHVEVAEEARPIKNNNYRLVLEKLSQK